MQVNLAKASVPRGQGGSQLGDRRGSGRGGAGGGAGGYQGGGDASGGAYGVASGGAYGVYGNAVAPAQVNPMAAMGAGQMLVQTMLPNGQVAYVLAQAPVMLGGQGGRGGPVRRGDDRPAPPRGRGRGDGRYRPY